MQFCLSVHFGTVENNLVKNLVWVKPSMLGVRSQGQLNLQNSENTSFNTTNSGTTSSSPPLESDIPDTKLGLNHPVLVPLSHHISLIRGSKLPLCVARRCRGPANECTPVQNGVQWKCVKRQRHSKCFSSFQLIFFQLVSFPFCIYNTNSAMKSRSVYIHGVQCVCFYLSLKCSPDWEAKQNISCRHLSVCFSFAEQQRADGFSQLYSQLQNYVQFGEIASCFFGVLDRMALKSVCRR